MWGEQEAGGNLTLHTISLEIISLNRKAGMWGEQEAGGNLTLRTISLEIISLNMLSTLNTRNGTQ